VNEQQSEPPAEAPSEDKGENSPLDPEAELQKVREFLERDRKGWGERGLEGPGNTPDSPEKRSANPEQLSAVAQALFSLLRRCLSRPDTCADVDRPGNTALADMFSVALLEPSSTEAGELETRWKQSAVSLLEDVVRARLPHAPKLFQGISQQGCCGLVLAALPGGTEKSVRANLDLLFLMLMESVVAGAPLLADFQSSGGSDTLRTLLCATDDAGIQDALVTFVERLCYVGPSDLTESLQTEDAYHFQHPDFKLPVDNGGQCQMTSMINIYRI
jgi:hypothetical protein